MKLDVNKLALASATTSAIFMVLLSIGNALGVYTEAALQMQKWHIAYSPNFVGTITGLIEAAIITYIFIWIAASIYNKMLSK